MRIDTILWKKEKKVFWRLQTSITGVSELCVLFSLPTQGCDVVRFSLQPDAPVWQRHSLVCIQWHYKAMGHAEMQQATLLPLKQSHSWKRRVFSPFYFCAWLFHCILFFSICLLCFLCVFIHFKQKINQLKLYWQCTLEKLWNATLNALQQLQLCIVKKTKTENSFLPNKYAQSLTAKHVCLFSTVFLSFLFSASTPPLQAEGTAAYPW